MAMQGELDGPKRPSAEIDATGIARAVRAVLWMGFVGLLTGGVWFRVTSLGTAPVPSADEAIYGVQAVNLLQGRSIQIVTASKHLLSPLLIGLELVPALLAGPSYTGIRLPAACCGLAAVALSYLVVRRRFDQTTGAIAAGLMASLPIAIVFSRIGWEPCLIPAYSLLCLALAFDGRAGRLLGAWLVGIALIHPTILMLGPILLGILLARIAREEFQTAGDRHRAFLTTALGGVSVILPLAWLAAHSKAARWTVTTYAFGPRNWGMYIANLERMFLGGCMGAPTDIGRLQSTAFLGVVLAVGVVGSWRLWRARARERLALIGGVVATAAVLHLAYGPDILQAVLVRYGFFLVAPSVLAFAFLARALLPDSGRPASVLVRNLGLFALLCGGYSLLYATRLNWFETFILQSGGVESVWTIGTETKDHYREIVRSLPEPISRKTAGGGESPTSRRPREVILADDWWHEEMLRYLTMRDPSIRVVGLEKLDPERKRETIRRVLSSGGIVVGPAGGGFSRELSEAISPASVRSQVIQIGWSQPSQVSWSAIRK
jgi:hypothetical protein